MAAVLYESYKASNAEQCKVSVQPAKKMLVAGDISGAFGAFMSLAAGKGAAIQIISWKCD